ncbi:MAG: hypothetical protein V4649_12370, partial [Bacteroidota bacterium]
WAGTGCSARGRASNPRQWDTITKAIAVNGWDNNYSKSAVCNWQSAFFSLLQLAVGAMCGLLHIALFLFLKKFGQGGGHFRRYKAVNGCILLSGTYSDYFCTQILTADEPGIQQK